MCYTVTKYFLDIQYMTTFILHILIFDRSNIPTVQEVAMHFIFLVKQYKANFMPRQNSYEIEQKVLYHFAHISIILYPVLLPYR